MHSAGHCWQMTQRSNGLEPGDRVRLSGGYFPNPEWRSGKDYLEGTVVGYGPGQDDNGAAVIKLDTSITAEGVTGDVLVLELRHSGASWGGTGFVHIELCDFHPEGKPWQDRRQGKWVESGAKYERLAE